MDRLLNIIRREALRVLSQTAKPRMGIVRSYDPDRYAVKVELQPEGTLTGWLSLGSKAVGNGWGVYSPPPIGTVVEVHFQEGDKESGFVGDSYFNTQTRPLPVPVGELWVVHQEGALLKFKNGGVVELSADTLVLHANTTLKTDTHGLGTKTEWTGGNNYTVTNYVTGANITPVTEALHQPQIP